MIPYKCPFCGRDPKTSQWQHDGVTYSAISCETPHCVLQRDGIIEGQQCDLHTLIELWNCRPLESKAEKDAGQAKADVVMWKANHEAAEQHVTILRQQLAETEAKWKATFEKRVAREEELLNDTIQETVNDVLAKLNAAGVDTSDCDGDDDVVTILAHWIESRISSAEVADDAEQKLRICLRALDLLRRDSKSPDFVKVYCALIEDEVHSSGGGGAEQAGDEQGESQSGARSATGKLSASAGRSDAEIGGQP